MVFGITQLQLTLTNLSGLLIAAIVPRNTGKCCRSKLDIVYKIILQEV
jgi:hypothetical protein